MTSSLLRRSAIMSPILGRRAALPPMTNDQPLFLPSKPMSLTMLSPQEKEQPEIPIFNLAGREILENTESISWPKPIASCTPYLQAAMPGQACT